MSDLDYIGQLKGENQSLRKQLDYLRSGEYLNQLKFEVSMLEDLVDNNEVSEEDKKFIDMTHRNTELLEENQELKNRLEEKENRQKKFRDWLENGINKADYEVNVLGNYKYLAWSSAYKNVLRKYKEIIGVKDE